MTYLRRLGQGWRDIVANDLALFKRFPKLGASVFAISLVPALYALIYLSSVWDPNARTSALPVAIVNLDAGITYRGQSANVGNEIVTHLTDKGIFGYAQLDDPAAAREAVNRGELAFAVIIPKDFSANAVPGTRAGAGKVTVVLSEGNNFTSAGFAKRFAVELGHQLNETLNERRWALVLSTADGSSKSLNQLKSGVAALQAGAQQLSTGAQQYGEAANRLTGGVKQLGAGVRAMHSKLPADSDLDALKSGHQQLVSGQRDLGKGLAQLELGAGQLTAGAGRLRDETAGILIVGDKISKGAGELAQGGTQLTDGLGKAKAANAQLLQGATQLESATGKLTDGMGALSGGIRTMATHLPDDGQLDEFNAAGQRLGEGASRLQLGMATLANALPRGIDKLDGSARGLAESVEPALEVLAPVANNGSAFAPNMVAVALWIGAVMTTYLFNLRLVLSAHAPAPFLAKSLGKFTVPAGVVLLQVLLCFLMVVYGLGVKVPNVGSFALTMALSSLVFLSMVYALLRMFGEAGKLLAVLLLTLQLAAGGGIIPVELSGDFFRAAHHWLPFSWVVQAFRTSLFGAYDNQWLHAWSWVLAGGVVALTLATWLGRWKVVELPDYRPGIEV